MIIPNRPHIEIRKYVRYLAARAELVSDSGFERMSVIEWQHDAVLQVVQACESGASTDEELTDARTISWDVFEYVTRLDVNLRDDNEEDYRPLSRRQYVLAMRAIVELRPDREMYLLHLNTRPAERGHIAAWACALDPDPRWLDEYPAPETLSEAVANGSWLRNSISGP